MARPRSGAPRGSRPCGSRCPTRRSRPSARCVAARPTPAGPASKHGCRLEAAPAPGRCGCCCLGLCSRIVRPCRGPEPDRAHVDGDGIRLQAVRPPGPPRRPRPDDDEDDDEEEEEENGVPMDDQYADGEGDPCPNCGRVYRRAPRAGRSAGPCAAWGGLLLHERGHSWGRTVRKRRYLATLGLAPPAARQVPPLTLPRRLVCVQDGRVLDRVRLLRRLVRRQVRTGAPPPLPSNAEPLH